MFLTFVDMDEKVKFEKDFMKFVYKIDGKLFFEYHMFPVKEPTNEIHEQASRDPNKLNIVIIMVDSVSRGSAQRYLKETYRMIEEDPNSFIMKV